MLFIVEEDLAAREQVFTLRIPRGDLAGMRPLDPIDRRALRWLGEQDDIESKLMALQILVRNIEAARATE